MPLYCHNQKQYRTTWFQAFVITDIHRLSTIRYIPAEPTPKAMCLFNIQNSETVLIVILWCEKRRNRPGLSFINALFRLLRFMLLAVVSLIFLL